MSILNVYLSGSIKKGASDVRSEECFWSPADEVFIEENVHCNIKLLNPSKSPIKRNDYFANFGCDLFLVQSSDIILVDLRTEKGLGVGAELMFAQSLRIPVIAWLPPNSYYRRSFVADVFGEDLTGWVHPFAHGLVDRAVDSLDEACRLLNQHANGNSIEKDAAKLSVAAVDYFARVYPDLVADVEASHDGFGERDSSIRRRGPR